MTFKAKFKAKKAKNSFVSQNLDGFLIFHQQDKDCKKYQQTTQISYSMSIDLQCHFQVQKGIKPNFMRISKIWRFSISFRFRMFSPSSILNLPSSVQFGRSREEERLVRSSFLEPGLGEIRGICIFIQYPTFLPGRTNKQGETTGQGALPPCEIST